MLVKSESASLKELVNQLRSAPYYLALESLQSRLELKCWSNLSQINGVNGLLQNQLNIKHQSHKIENTIIASLLRKRSATQLHDRGQDKTLPEPAPGKKMFLQAAADIEFSAMHVTLETSSVQKTFADCTLEATPMAQLVWRWSCQR
jgi:hypothetical protein